MNFSGTARFKLVRPLGQGGMGIVYEAVDAERSAAVALKVLQRLSPADILRFKNEFRSFHDIQHRNLVSLGELFEEAGWWFFTMELVPGVDFLKFVHPQGGGLDEGRLRKGLTELTLGLMALHHHRKVHGDVKPSNILVTPQGRVVLLDFGTGTEEGAGKPDLGFWGSAAYVAPEQLGSGAVSAAADYYSLGTLLYCALTNALPFAGSAVEILEAKRQRRDLKGILDFPKGTPADLKKLCLDLLQVAPEKRPGGKEILARLSSALAHGLAPSVQLPPSFVGRSEELRLLKKALDETRDGQALTVCLHGESGVGKSALMHQFLRTVQADCADTVVLQGRCYERESISFKAVDGIVDNLSKYLLGLPDSALRRLMPMRAYLLPQIFPTLGRVDAFMEARGTLREELDPSRRRSQAFAALRELFGRLAEVHPVVVAIDDLQWADEDSMRLLRDLLQPTDAPPVLLLITRRTTDSSVDGVSDNSFTLNGRVRHLWLGPLGAQESLTLATTLLGWTEKSSESAQAIAEEAKGHPLFIRELVRYRQTHLSETSMFQFEDVIAARLDGLEPELRTILTLVSIAGMPVDSAVLALAVNAKSPSEFSKNLLILQSANFLRTSSQIPREKVEPYHDRIREAVLSRLTPEARVDFHRRLARALEASGCADSEMLATLWQGTGELFKAAAHAAAAARRAVKSLAFERAIALYRLALELNASKSLDEHALNIELGSALVNAGRGVESSRAFLAALDPSKPDAMELRHRAADQLLRSGRVDEALALYSPVLAEINLRMPKGHWRLHANILLRRAELSLRGLKFARKDPWAIPPDKLQQLEVYWSMTLGLCLVDSVRGFYFQTRMLLLALKLGDPKRVLLALTMESNFLEADGRDRHRKQAEKLRELANTLLAETSLEYHRAHVITADACAAFFRQQLHLAVELADEAIAVMQAHCPSTAWEQATLNGIIMSALMDLGEIQELKKRVTIHWREAEARGDQYAAMNVRPTASCLVRLAADDPDESRRECRQAIRGWSQAGFHAQHMFMLISEIQTELYAGCLDEAYGRLESQWPALEKSMLLWFKTFRQMMVELRARTTLAFATQRKKGWESLLRRIARQRKQLSGSAFGSMSSLFIEAGIASVRHDREGAKRALRQGLVEADRAHRGLHAAAARRRLGLLLGGGEGAELLEAGDRWMREQGVTNPDRMTSLFLPGCWDQESVQ